MDGSVGLGSRGFRAKGIYDSGVIKVSLRTTNPLKRDLYRRPLPTVHVTSPRCRRSPTPSLYNIVEETLSHMILDHFCHPFPLWE